VFIKYENGIQIYENYTQLELTTITEMNKLLDEHLFVMEQSFSVKRGLAKAMKISQLANAYFQHAQPWNKSKDNTVVLTVAINFVLFCATLLEPFIPSLCHKIIARLNFNGKLEIDKFKIILMNHKLQKETKMLFKQITTLDIKCLRVLLSQSLLYS